MRRLVAALLWLFPSRFRRDYGADLLATFHDRWREQAGGGLALRTVVDLIRSALLERISEPKGDGFMTTLRQDLAFAVRMLAKTPGFTLVAIVTLALGIGANSAIYSVVSAVLFKGLPYPDAERLVFITEELPKSKVNVSWPDYLDWRAQNQVFDDLAVFQGTSRATFLSPAEPKSLVASSVSSSFFLILGAKTVLGRTFGEADDKPGAAPVAVLSYSMWRNELKGDPDAIGKEVNLGGTLYTVAGVLAPEFQFQLTNSADVYLPVGLVSNQPHFVMRANHPGLMVIAKMRAGVPLERARADMKTVMERLAKAYPESNRGETAIVTPLAERLIGGARSELLMLLGAVAAVLLIACANVAHLSLARATAREREFAIRAAVGASRGRLVRQLLAESALLSLLGGVTGLLLAYWALPPLIAMYPYSVPGLKQARLDSGVFLFTLGLCVLAAALFGLAPMMRAARSGVGAGLKEGAGSDSGRQGRRLRSVLFVAEIATAVVLTAGAGLLLRSLAALLDVNPGFRADHLLVLDVVRSRGGEPGFFERVLERIAAQPGVESAGAASCAPLSGTLWTSPYAPEGLVVSNQSPWTAINAVMPGYLQTIQARLLEGRLLIPHDGAQSRPVTVVNETMARRTWPEGGAVGKRIRVKYALDEPLEVVGVIADVKQNGLQGIVQPEVFIPARPRMPLVAIVVRTSGDPAALARSVTAAILSVDKNQPASRIMPMTNRIAGMVVGRKFAALRLTLFGALAVLLAAVGVSGVMAYTVAQRTREFGIRMAVGAHPGQMLRLVLGQGLRLTALGVVLGLAGAWASSRFLEQMLFGVKPHDPLTYGAVALLLAGVALAACVLPARRASRVDPITALRYD